MTRLSRTLCTGLATALMLSGCVAIAPPMNEQEADLAVQADVNQYLPASREMRENIETQELFAQAAFWSHEYDLNPSDLEAAIKLAAAVRKLGNPARAVEITQTTRAIHPRDPYLLAEHAAGLIADERALDALPVLDQGLRLAPQYGRLWSLKGAALDQTEDYQRARQHYARALQITPDDPNVLANVGLSHALSGDPATAEGWLRRAAAQPGAGAGVRQNLALVLQLQGKTEESQRHARTARLSRGDRRLPRDPVAAHQPRGGQFGGSVPSQGSRSQAPRSQASRPQAPQSASPTGLQRRPGARLTTSAPSGQQFRSASDAARAAAAARHNQQGYAQQTYSQPAPSTAPAQGKPKGDVLAQIARNVGPQAATPQRARRGQPSQGQPHIVGPAPRQPQPPAQANGYAPQSYGYPAPQPTDRRGAARRRR